MDTWKAFGKSSWQKLLLKSLNFFSENRKKHKISNCCSLFAFSKLILCTQRMHLSQFYPRLLEVGLLIHAWFFFDKKTKKSRSRSEDFEKVLNFFRKKHFRKKCPIELQNWQSRWRFLAKRLRNFSSKYRSLYEKRFSSITFSACVKVSFESPTENFLSKGRKFLALWSTWFQNVL